ncbi:MAG: hypothetical protein EAZ35_02160 [Sphingobacteriia bacterium]|nr:MAG: hypothetical protein EAZ35_02160 [Sphingobacteriia bacterium]
MAKTKAEIKQIILNNYINERSVAGLPYDNPANWSIYSVRKLWVSVFTYCWFLVEQVLDTHISDVNKQILDMKPPTLRWMRGMAMNFQYGSALVTDQDYYNNAALSEAQINTQLIIKAAAAVTEDGIVKIKAVTEVAGDYYKLSALQLAAFQNYIFEVLPPIPLQVISTDPDRITTEYDVYYDTSILMPNGMSIIKGNKPVEEAFKLYLKQLEFNGWFIKEKMEDKIQAVTGVVTLREKYTRCAAFTNPNLTTITVVYKPFSGFLRYYNEADLKINYMPWQA